MKPSGMLQKRSAVTQQLLDVMQRTMKQYMLDTLLVTMHEDFGWGYDRLTRLEERWSETYDHFFPALQSQKGGEHEDGRDCQGAAEAQSSGRLARLYGLRFRAQLRRSWLPHH